MHALRVSLEKNATQATNSICLVYGDHSLDVRTCQNWFARFKSGDLISLTSTVVEGQLKQMILF